MKSPFNKDNSKQGKIEDILRWVSKIVQSNFYDNKSDEFPISIKVEVWARKIR